MEHRIARYVGIDIGKKSNSLCGLDKDQKIVASFDFRHTIEDYRKVLAVIDKDSRIVIEPTGVYSLHIYFFLRDKDYQIRFSNTSSSTHTIRSETAGVKKKTDPLDAKGLALHSIIHWKKCNTKIPYIDNIKGYNNTLFYIRVRELLEEYKLLSKESSNVQKKINTLLSLRFPELSYIFKKKTPKLAMKFMSLEKEDYMFPAEEIARAMGVKKECHLKYVEEMKAALSDSLAVKTGLFDVKITETKQLIRELNILKDEQKDKERRLRDLINISDFRRLYDFKGLNTVGIAILITEIRNISSFFVRNSDGSINHRKSLKSFKKYCGFDVTSNQSGERKGGGRLARCRSRLRGVFYMMALTYISQSLLQVDEKIEVLKSELADLDKDVDKPAISDLKKQIKAEKENRLIIEYYLEKSQRMANKKAVVKTATHLCAKVYFLVKDLDWEVKIE